MSLNVVPECHRGVVFSFQLIMDAENVIGLEAQLSQKSLRGRKKGHWVWLTTQALILQISRIVSIKVEGTNNTRRRGQITPDLGGLQPGRQTTGRHTLAAANQRLISQRPLSAGRG